MGTVTEKDLTETELAMVRAAEKAARKPASKIEQAAVQVKDPLLVAVGLAVVFGLLGVDLGQAAGAFLIVNGKRILKIASEFA